MSRNLAGGVGNSFGWITVLEMYFDVDLIFSENNNNHGNSALYL